MLCEISLWGNFWSTWFLLSLLALILLLIMSGVLFKLLYWKPTFEQWQYKSNPEYPPPEKVKLQIIQMLKGLFTATLCPALSLYLSQKGLSQGYCGIHPEKGLGWGYTIFSFWLVLIVSDFLEFLYHRIGHTSDYFWKVHKSHHVFFNPSPFSVIADEYFDQLWRASPLFFFPLFMPMNMDLIFFQFGLWFYVYGVYLHSGFETDLIDAHNPILNTSFQHYIHHAASSNGEPFHTGFFFQIWDQLFGSVYNKECVCAKCERKKGNRTIEKWNLVKKPDYSVLLQPSFWIQGVKG